MASPTRHPLTTPVRRVVGAVCSLLVALIATVGLSAPAHAEGGYRYWNYFHLEDGAWAFSQVGPAEYQPEDGAVEGFRFGTSTMSQGIEPRADLDEVNFDTVCSGVEAAAGEKRVAVLLDYGTDEGVGTPPEPRAECAVVAADATTQDVLGEIADLRLEKGMVCGIDGHPATGCGDPVKNAEVPTDEEPVAFALPDAGSAEESAADQGEDEGGLPLPLVAVAALVVLLAAGGYLVSRRSKSA